MNAISLYSGGCDGMSLAASWLGIETTAYCDSEPACRAVLAARHPDRPIFTSDEDVTPDGLRAVGIDPAGIDLVMGGPPCQCASVAGKRLGAADPRNRWPQFVRIVREIGPRWIMAENSPGLLTVDDGRLFGDVLRGLAEAGYDVCWDCWGAADVGAPHRRDRLFILGMLADADILRREPRRAKPEGFGWSTGIDCRGKLANTHDTGLQIAGSEPGFHAVSAGDGTQYGGGVEHAEGERRKKRHLAALDGQARQPYGRSDSRRRAGPAQPRLGRDVTGLSRWMDEAARRLEAQKWPAGRGQEQYDWEPPRVAHGIPDRAARLGMIGNACPPQQYLVGLAAIRTLHEMRGG